MSTTYVVSLIFSLNSSTSLISNNRPCSSCGSNKYFIVRKCSKVHILNSCSLRKWIEPYLLKKAAKRRRWLERKLLLLTISRWLDRPTDRRRRHLMNNAWRIWLYYVLVYFQLQQSNSSSSIFTHRPAKAKMLSYHKTSFKLLRAGTTWRKAKAT